MIQYFIRLQCSIFALGHMVWSRWAPSVQPSISLCAFQLFLNRCKKKIDHNLLKFMLLLSKIAWIPYIIGVHGVKPITAPKHPRQQSSWGQHWTHLGPVDPRWAPWTLHAVHSTAWCSRSEGLWKGPEYSFSARWQVPQDHRPAHSRGLSKPIKSTGQALTLIDPFHKRHYNIILTLK